MKKEESMGLSLYAGEGEREFIDLTESFARKAVLPMFGGDSADGRSRKSSFASGQGLRDRACSFSRPADARV